MKKFGQFISVLVLLLLFSTIAYGTTWTTNKRLTNNAGSAFYPAIAVDGSNIYVVWEDDTPGNREIYFKKSIDEGVTWSPNKRLTNNAGDSSYAAIAVDGSNIYVVWSDDISGNYEIYFKKSIDGGATWSTNKRLTYTGYLPAIAVDGSNVYVVWNNHTGRHWEIYFKMSDDGGVTWSTNKRLTYAAGISNNNNPVIAVDGSNIYVVWEDDTPQIYFKKSVDGGATWSTNKRLTNSARGSDYPAIAVGGSNIYVVWEDDTPWNEEIYFKTSADGGATWTANKRLTNNAGYSTNPVIAVDGSNIYVVWEDDTPGNWEIYFKMSDDGGVTWSTNKRLTNNAGYSNNPAIAVYGSNIYVVWQDTAPGHYEIYFKKGSLF